MSCNGCRVLRKGCSEGCVLRTCLEAIDGADAQGHATIFVAKFFGRAGLLAFVSAVPSSRRPELFRSLLYEACGRTVNPVGGAVGLLWSGRWDLCESAVEKVLRGGAITADAGGIDGVGDLYARSSGAAFSFSSARRRKTVEETQTACDLKLGMSPGREEERRRRRQGRSVSTPLEEEEEASVTTSDHSSAAVTAPPQLLNLFI